MQYKQLKVVSLNVNGLNNKMKRARILRKIKKDNSQINYLQETHLSDQEHEKLKKMGFKNTFHSSYRGGCKRGVAILISNSLQFETLKEIRDKEGRYVLVKGKVENHLITLMNIYAPPDSGKDFYRNIFKLLIQEAQGLMICGGDFNLTLNKNLDTTSTKINKRNRMSRYVNNVLAELGMIDVWRDMHPLERDYTFYSAPHAVHTRIDYVFMNMVDRFRIEECMIGVADVSDHAALHLTLNLNDTKKNMIWRMNISVLNDPTFVEEIKMGIKTYNEENNNGEVDYIIIWDAMKAVMRGKLISQASYLKKMRQKEYHVAIDELKHLERRHKSSNDSGLLQQLKELRAKINMILGNEVEKKLRFVKQTFYECGPKASKMLARRIKKQQIANTIYKIRDPRTKTLEYEPGKINKIFENYYKNYIHNQTRQMNRQ